MYDFLYAFGVGIIQPALFTAINGAHPVFNRVTRQITEKDLAGNVIFASQGSSQTGTLDQSSTQAVRVAIAKFVKAYSHAAPQIGIYTAGRFCQLATIKYFESGHPNDSSLADILNLLNQAYRGALGSGPASSLPAFPALLAAFALDVRMIESFASPTAEFLQVLSEFGIPGTTGKDWDMISAYVKSQSFVTASGFLMTGDSNPWLDTSSAEGYLWWTDDHTSHAIP